MLISNIFHIESTTINPQVKLTIMSYSQTYAHYPQRINPQNTSFVDLYTAFYDVEFLLSSTINYSIIIQMLIDIPQILHLP